MSSARTADSRHCKSLFHSRSLRDFSSPPPSRADKPQRRILQVNGVHVVRQPYQFVSGLSEPSHAELVQSFQNPKSHSSVQVSPFIAAPRTSFDGVASSPASSYESSPRFTARCPSISPSGTGVHKLRKPPVDPRRHRRFCSDFGLNREEARASPALDVSSLASTPLTTYTEADSDSDLSFNQSLGYSFPEPPPISETLHLRRMHSSPMFDLGETDQVRDILRKRWGVSIQVPKPLPAPFNQLDGTSSVDSPQPSDLEDLDMYSTIHRVSKGQYSPSLPLPPLPGAGKNNSWKRATTAILHNRQSEAAALSLARSASSVGLREDPPTKAHVSPAAQKRFGALPAELSQSIDRLDLSIAKLKAHNPRQLSSLGATVLEEDRKKREFRMSLSPPSLASAGRKKPVPRPYDPLPTFKPDAGHPSTSVPPKVSWTPPDYQPVRKQSVVPLTTPRSFMDLTPERQAERDSRSRVRKLLARASVSMLNWGKNVSRVKGIMKGATVD